MNNTGRLEIIFNYLATPPDLFLTIIKQLHTCGLTHEEEGKWRRFIIEKPFGHDLRSANELRQLLEILKENQIYRIDHYLGKETGAEYFDLPVLEQYSSPTYGGFVPQFCDGLQLRLGDRGLPGWRG